MKIMRVNCFGLYLNSVVYRQTHSVATLVPRMYIKCSTSSLQLFATSSLRIAHAEVETGVSASMIADVESGPRTSRDKRHAVESPLHLLAASTSHASHSKDRDSAAAARRHAAR